MVMLAAMPAFAQKAEVGVTFGWVLSDGVDFGSNVVAPGGVSTASIPRTPSAGASTSGFFISPNSEVGFLYGQQLSTLQASGKARCRQGYR